MKAETRIDAIFNLLGGLEEMMLFSIAIGLICLLIIKVIGYIKTPNKVNVDENLNSEKESEVDYKERLIGFGKKNITSSKGMRHSSNNAGQHDFSRIVHDHGSYSSGSDGCSSGSSSSSSSSSFSSCSGGSD